MSTGTNWSTEKRWVENISTRNNVSRAPQPWAETYEVLRWKKNGKQSRALQSISCTITRVQLQHKTWFATSLRTRPRVPSTTCKNMRYKKTLNANRNIVLVISLLLHPDITPLIFPKLRRPTNLEAPDLWDELHKAMQRHRQLISAAKKEQSTAAVSHPSVQGIIHLNQGVIHLHPSPSYRTARTRLERFWFHPETRWIYDDSTMINGWRRGESSSSTSFEARGLVCMTDRPPHGGTTSAPALWSCSEAYLAENASQRRAHLATCEGNGWKLFELEGRRSQG